MQSGEFQNLFASVTTQDGLDEKDFDFDLDIKQEGISGSSDKLAIEGRGQKDGTDFTFSVPVKQFKMEYQLGTKVQEKLEFKANVYTEAPIVFDVTSDGLKVEGIELNDELKSTLVRDSRQQLLDLKKQTQEAKLEKSGVVPYFPLDIAIPFVCWFYVSQLSQKIEVSEKYVSFDLSIEHFNILKKKQLKMLKPITGDFTVDSNKQGDQAFLQFMIDDNFANSVASVFSTVDQMFSVRSLSKGVAKAKPILDILTTDTVAMAIPDFGEDVGHGKKIDIVFSPSHELFLDGVPNSKISGMYIDKNGNFKFQMNMMAQLNVEQMPEVWEPARHIYVTFVFKMKLQLLGDHPSNKKLVINPKNVEMTEIKVLKGEEEMAMEQMLIQSMVNIQLDQLKKFMKEIPLPLDKVFTKVPKELECIGIKLSDIDLTFKKS